MIEWTEAPPRIRDDDPYHAWAYNQNKAQGGAQSGLCPAVLSIQAGTADETYEELLSNLQKLRNDWIKQDTNDAPFVMSAHDLAHLSASIEHIGKHSGHIAGNADYLRMFLVYAKEADLFPRNSDLWQNGIFEILFVGRAIRDEQMPNAFYTSDQAQAVAAPSAGLTIIDDSIAFLNDAFVAQTDEDGQQTQKSRFSEIWFQERETVGRNKVYTGSRLGTADLDALLAKKGNQTEADIYAQPVELGNGMQFLPIDLTSEDHQPLAFPISHGTHVAATALNCYDENAEGRELALFGITIPVEVTQDTSGSIIGAYLIAALRQAMLWNDAFYQCREDSARSGDQEDATQVPLVINFSYGFPAGPKDGSSPLNRVIARMLDARNAMGRVTKFVVPMGNTYESRGIARKTLGPGEVLALDWVLQDDDHTASFLELYFGAAGGAEIAFDATLHAPSREIAPLHATADAPAQHLAGAGLHLAEWGEWALSEGSGWSRRAVLAIAPTTSYDTQVSTVPAGRWQLEIKNTSDAPLDVMLTVQRDDAPGTYPVKAKQSYLDHPRAWQSRGESDAAEPEDHDQLDPDGPITHAQTASNLASIDSEHVIVVGAGMGAEGDRDEQTPVEPSPYASQGPCRPNKNGPDYIALADRSYVFRGVYGPGTYSGSSALVSGSSVAAPQIAGWLAAELAKNPAD